MIGCCLPNKSNLVIIEFSVKLNTWLACPKTDFEQNLV